MFIDAVTGQFQMDAVLCRPSFQPWFEYEQAVIHSC